MMKKTLSRLVSLYLIAGVLLLLGAQTVKAENVEIAGLQDYLPTIGYWGGVWGGAKTSEISQGENTIVAVIDDGVWLAHPDLQGNIWTNNAEIKQNGNDDDHNGYTDDYYGWNFISNNSDMTPLGLHATGVATIIGANNMGMVGIAPKTKIMSLIACDDSGCPRSAVLAAIRYAADKGADVINLSLGSSNGYVGYTEEYNEAIQYAYDRNAVIVAAAGNGDPSSKGTKGQNLDFSKASPVSNDVGGFNTVIGVGAVAGTTPQGALYPTAAQWSNYGSSAVDVWAPGADIVTGVVPEFANKSYYGVLDGTSFAAPMVSAAAALLKSQNKSIKNWVIVDEITTQKYLNIKSLLSPTMSPKCTTGQLSSNNITAGDMVTLTGQRLGSKIEIYLSAKNGGTSTNIRSQWPSFDGNHGVWDTGLLKNVPTGDYNLNIIIDSGYVNSCSGNFTVHITNNTPTPPENQQKVSQSSVAVQRAGSLFKDVPDDSRYISAIQLMKERGIVSGYPDGTFKPNNNLNRAEFVAILMKNVNAEIPDAPKSGCSFKDVKPTDWFAKSVCFAKSQGYTQGYPDGTFKPNDNVNLVEAVALTVRVFGMSVGTDKQVWYKPFIDKAAEKKLIPITLASFDQKLTRQEMADMIVRFISNKEGRLDSYLQTTQGMSKTINYDCLKNKSCN